MDLTSKIIKIKKELENAKIEKAKIEGKISNILEDLKKNYGVKDINEISEIIKKEEKIIEKLENEINDKLEVIEKEFDL